MDWQIITIGIAVASLLLNVGIAVAGATWGIAKLRVAVSEEISKHRADFEEKMQAYERNAGETAAALRTKIHEFELWVRDNFVRRDSFLAVISEVRVGISDLGQALDRRLSRIENHLIGRQPERDER